MKSSIQKFARKLLAQVNLTDYVSGISINEDNIELSLVKDKHSRRFINSLLAEYNCDPENTRLDWCRREANIVISEYQPKITMLLTLEELKQIESVLPERKDIGWMIVNFDSIAE